MRVLIFFLLIIIVFSSCNPFAPSLVDDESIISSITVTEQASPRDVLVNFRYAYVFKDSLIYADLLDSSFIFIATNYGTNPPSDILWGRDKDIRSTVGLFRRFNSLDLTWGDDFLNDSTLYSYTDSLNSNVIITFQLTVIGDEPIPTLKGEAFFSFKKQSSGRWRITRWEDLSSF
jgi:hypothetical protein